MNLIKILKYKLRELLHDRISILLCAVFTVGILIRILGVYPGYSPYHPDEGKAGYVSAWNMFINRTLDLAYYNYPALIPEVQLVFLIIIFIPIIWIKFIITEPNLFMSHLNSLPDIFQNYIVPKSNLDLMYFSRYLMALFGIGTLFLTYFTAKYLFSSRIVALLATLVLALNLRSVTSSQLDLPDGYSSFFLILAFYVVVKMSKNSTLKAYILSGISIGMAISTKLQMFSIIPFLLLHFFHALENKKIKQKILSIVSLNFFWGIVFLFLTIVIVNINPLMHFQKFYEVMSHQARLYGFGFNKLGLSGLSYMYYVVLTPPITFLAMFGTASGLLVSKHKLSVILLLSVVIPYLYYFLYLTRGWYYPRNFVSVTPFFAILAAVGLFYVFYLLQKIAKNKLAGKCLFIFFLSAVLFESTKNSLIHTINYMKPWNVSIMRNCLADKIVEGKTVAAHPTDKYILFSLPSTDVKKKLSFAPLNILTAPNFNLAELQSEKIDYALIGLDVVQDSNSNWWMVKPDFWSKPTKISMNVFISLAAREFFQNTVCSAVKPWQAVENNYAFVKIPPVIDFQGKKIDSFNFDDEIKFVEWKKIDGFGGKGSNLIWSDEGNGSDGALEIKAVHPTFPVVRWVSPPFLVSPGFTYKAESWVKSEVKLSDKQKDGFLRMDFYEKEPGIWDENTESLNVSLSSRYFGSGWQKKDVVAVAPRGARIATISFQVSDPKMTTFWFDDLIIFEDRKIPSRLVVGQMDDYVLEIDDDVFVPNIGSGY